MPSFELQFNRSAIRKLADRYAYADDAGPSGAGWAAADNGYYDEEGFLEVCGWKAPRARSKFAANTPSEIEDATRRAFAAEREDECMEALLTLRGVGIPIASTLLHFAFPDDYPILDARALEALGCRSKSVYPVSFWLSYLEACRDLASENDVDIRTLDKALWQWSKEGGSELPEAPYFRSKDVKERDALEQFDDQRNKAYDELPRVNILLTGQTGAGKSTLINAILRKPVAKTGVGRPVTDHIRAWSVEGIPITLYDTPGVELGKQAKALRKEFKQLMDRLAGTSGDRIHLIWHCLNAESKRFQDYEIDLIKTLSEQAPTILVLTQCLGPENQSASEFARELTEIIREEDLDVAEGRPFKTLALPRRINSITIEPFGLQELVELSYGLLPEAVRRAFINAQGVELKLKEKEARKVALSASVVAAGIGATPIPIPDAGPLLLLQASMLARIAVVMGVDLDANTRGFLLKGLLGTATAGRQTASFLLKFWPVVGPAINAAVAGALTVALGEAFTRLCSEILRREADGHPMPRAEMLDLLFDEFKRLYKRKGE